MTCRWRDEHGDNLYDTFIPEVERPAIAQDGDVPELQPGEKRKLQPRRPPDKGALLYKYSRDVHEWLTQKNGGSPSRFINQPRSLRQRLWPHHEGAARQGSN